MNYLKIIPDTSSGLNIHVNDETDVLTISGKTSYEYPRIGQKYEVNLPAGTYYIRALKPIKDFGFYARLYYDDTRFYNLTTGQNNVSGLINAERPIVAIALYARVVPNQEYAFYNKVKIELNETTPFDDDIPEIEDEIQYLYSYYKDKYYLYDIEEIKTK